MYETEEQQVEALKKWWKDNGKSIIAGIVIGLGAVLGWRAWVQHQDRVAGQASNEFDKLVLAAARQDPKAVSTLADHLVLEYDGTPYPTFARLMQARVALTEKHPKAAEKALRAAIESAPDRSIRAVAVLRLARLFQAEGDADGAASLLSTYPVPKAFAAEAALVKGDIALAKGDTAAARRAYQSALDKGVGNADLVRLKLNDLPAT